MNLELSANDFVRLANNFYNSLGIPSDYNRIVLDSHLANYITAHKEEVRKKSRVAFCCICLNQPYWEFVEPMIQGAKQFFLPGHETDFFLWSDIPQQNNVELQKALELLRSKQSQDKNAYADGKNDGLIEAQAVIEKAVNESEKKYGATIFPTEAVPWPMPTLLRYSLFLQQEEILKDYDYIFYCDVDMKFVGIVGDEILGKGLTAALHPGYATRKEYWPPYEPNKKSSSYILRPGQVINDAGKPRFMPMYFAGGLQGGTTKEWFKAMRAMKKMIDKDLINNYIPIWNDETAWNKYLEDTPEDLVVLTPSYIYPDSLINEYYIPLWGVNYAPKLMTLTKKFSVSAEGGEAVRKMIGQ